jgi:hypothetical protein
MIVQKIGAQIVVTDPDGYPPQDYDITSMHAREKVTPTTTTITDLANPNVIYTSLNSNFSGDSGPIATQSAIKAYLREIIGS